MITQLRVEAPVWPQHFKEADKKDSVQKIARCAHWLHAQGFQVICAQAGGRNPRIIIGASLLCEQLEGAVRMYERGPQGERRYWVAIRFGCEVRWMESEVSYAAE